MKTQKNHSKGSLEVLTASVSQIMAIAQLCLVFKGQKVLEEKCEKGTQVHNAVNMKYNTYSRTPLSD